MPQDPDSTERPSTRFIRLYDRGAGRWRPAVMAFPPGKGTSYCVVHTAEDYSRKVKCRTRRQYEHAIEPRAKAWSPTLVQKKHLVNAGRGYYDGDAMRAGYESVYSYVLALFEEEESFAVTWHEDRKVPA